MRKRISALKSIILFDYYEFEIDIAMKYRVVAI